MVRSITVWSNVTSLKRRVLWWNGSLLENYEDKAEAWGVPGSQLRMLKLGREALEYRPDLRSQWDKKSVSVMFEAVSAKFGQNLELREKLKSTGIRPLGESTFHTVWGAVWGGGLHPEDERAKDTSKWAFNLLGLILIFVRYFLS